MYVAPDIPGAADVLAWFGYWPTFHDAQVLSITLNRSGESKVAIHAFEATDEVDARGFHVLRKHCLVTFCFEGVMRDQWGITRTELAFFNEWNELSSAWVVKHEAGFELVLEGAVGLDGKIMCKEMSVRIEPYLPAQAEASS